MSRAIAALRPLGLAQVGDAGPRLLSPLLGVLALVNRSSGSAVVRLSRRGIRASRRQPTSLDTEGQIEQLQAAVRADPSRRRQLRAAR